MKTKAAVADESADTPEIKDERADRVMQLKALRQVLSRHPIPTDFLTCFPGSH